MPSAGLIKEMLRTCEFLSTLTETNQASFNLIGKSELVSGFNVEYAAGPFATFFLAKYTNTVINNMKHFLNNPISGIVP